MTKVNDAMQARTLAGREPGGEGGLRNAYRAKVSVVGIVMFGSICASAVSKEALAQRDGDSDAPKGGSPTIAGFFTEALQLEIPRVDILPDTIFTNVNAIGVAFQLPSLELAPQFKLLASSTSAESTMGGSKTNASASGIGWAVGIRAAIGWIGPDKAGFYFFVFPAYSDISLSGHFSGGAPIQDELSEFSSEFGFGYKVHSWESVWLDVFVSAAHIGFRPNGGDVVSLTSYPAIGLSLDWVWTGLQDSPSKGGPWSRPSYDAPPPPSY